MEKEIIINVSLGETRIAILEDQKLVELYFERPESERMVGDIYYARVAKVVKGMQAAFIDIGQQQDAFLHFSEILIVCSLTINSPRAKAPPENAKETGMAMMYR